jgi:hypothetical protein
LEMIFFLCGTEIHKTLFKKLLRAYVVLFYYVPNQNKVFLSYKMGIWIKSIDFF